jgi:putative membrane protein
MLPSNKKPHWQTEGKEPDYRFSLANERTFLAWIRTSLAVLAAASFLHQLDQSAGKDNFSKYASVALALLSAAISFVAYIRWRNHEIAMRHDQPLNGGVSLVFSVIFTCCLAVGFCIYILR